MLNKSSYVRAGSGSSMDTEECMDFPGTEACKLFERFQLLACFYPGIDVDTISHKRIQVCLQD